MAEGFELVRAIREHLRRSAAYLTQGDVTAALAEANEALALDAQSLPAQAMRDRIERIRIRQARPTEGRSSTGSVPAQSNTGSFVPQGVNAASWRGFEQRILERRFRALLETMNSSIVAGDAASAHIALEEARELCPLAPELRDCAARVAALREVSPVRETMLTSRIWVRALGAVALLVIGVSLMIGLEWMRPEVPVGPVPAALPAAPPVPPTRDLRLAATPLPKPALVAINREPDAAAVTSEEIPLIPQGTSGSASSVPGTDALPTTLDIASTNSESRRLLDVAPDAARVAALTTGLPAGEVPDDYVVPPLRSAVATAADLSRSPMPPVRMPAVMSSMREERTSAAGSVGAVVPAAIVPAGDQRRVEDVLRRYARAYGDLNASAAREVWPSVDEKALARAFQGLASQDVSFNDCDIQIRGAVANASCRGHASYVGKVGRHEPRTEARLWRFELRRDGEAWKIENAEARRESTRTAYRDP